MLDGRVGAIRSALDGRGLVDTAILSYAAKYASAFYGPFRERSTRRAIRRPTRFSDPPNGREAVRGRLRPAEDADVVMVEPQPRVSQADIVR
jgi:porphobilinogen synthase